MHHNPVTLPSKEVLHERLLQVDEDIHFQMHLYPKILKSAGQQKTAMGVVLLLRIAINEYAGGAPLIEASMLVRMPEFIDALVIDKGVIKEAKDYFEKEMAIVNR